MERLEVSQMVADDCDGTAVRAGGLVVVGLLVGMRVGDLAVATAVLGRVTATRGQSEAEKEYGQIA